MSARKNVEWAPLSTSKNGCKWVATHPQKTVVWRGRRVQIDEKMAGLIRELWRVGIRTLFSCQGGEKRPADVVVASNGEHVQVPETEKLAYIHFEDYASAERFESMLYVAFTEGVFVLHSWELAAYRGKLAVTTRFLSDAIPEIESWFKKANDEARRAKRAASRKKARGVSDGAVCCEPSSARSCSTSSRALSVRRSPRPPGARRTVVRRL